MIDNDEVTKVVYIIPNMQNQCLTQTITLNPEERKAKERLHWSSNPTVYASIKNICKNNLGGFIKNYMKRYCEHFLRVIA